MKTKLINLWELLRASFWFIPLILLFGAIATSVVMVAVDRLIDTLSAERFWFLYNVSPEGARSILSTIAGSMITVAGVTFSITIVALNLASSQFGPRLLKNFMQDRKTQFVLGTFVSTYVYCLFILRSIQPLDSVIFIPRLAITFGVVLSLFNVGVLIFFIHHIAVSIQADEVVAAIGRELKRNVDNIFPDEREETNPDLSQKIADLQEENREHQHLFGISAPRSGYLQAIDFDGLMHFARENSYLIHVNLRPGQFVVENSVMASVLSAEPVDNECTEPIVTSFIIGNQRSSEQDIEYSIHQLVEVAVRALSPGVNDPYTAIACIDQLGTSLCFLARRHFTSPNCFDDDGKLLLRIKPFTYGGILKASFDQIRQNGIGCPAVTIRLLEMLAIISEQSCHPDQREAILRQGTMIIHGIKEVRLEQHDKEDILERYQILLDSLNSFADRVT